MSSISKKDFIRIDTQRPFLNTQTNDFSITLIFDFKTNLKEDYIDNHPKYNKTKINSYLFDKKFKISSKKDKGVFWKNDIILYKSVKIQMTNSVLYFLNNFLKKEEFFKFNKKITNKPITVKINIYKFIDRRAEFSMSILP